MILVVLVTVRVIVRNLTLSVKAEALGLNQIVGMCSLA